MPAIKEENLRAQLKSKCLKPVYLLYGPDAYLKQYYAEKIAAASPATGAAMLYAILTLKNWQSLILKR